MEVDAELLGNDLGIDGKSPSSKSLNSFSDNLSSSSSYESEKSEERIQVLREIERARN
jgi:hypothetical protein